MPPKIGPTGSAQLNSGRKDAKSQINSAICIKSSDRNESGFFNNPFDTILDDEGRRKHLEGIPLRRMGDPEKDIGATVVFLAGPGGGYITSRTLHLDGGNCCYDR